MSAKFDQEESQFKIQETCRKRKGGASNKSHHYSVVTYQMRVKLINLASSKGYSISRAARELGIKPSTGKFIVKCYRDHGKIMKKTAINSSKSGINSHESSGGESGEHKEQKSEKFSSPTKIFEISGETNAVENTIPIVSQNVLPQMFYFSYPYQQSAPTPIIMCQGLQYLNGTILPVYISQAF